MIRNWSVDTAKDPLSVPGAAYTGPKEEGMVAKLLGPRTLLLALLTKKKKMNQWREWLSTVTSSFDEVTEEHEIEAMYPVERAQNEINFQSPPIQSYNTVLEVVDGLSKEFPHHAVPQLASHRYILAMEGRPCFDFEL